MKSDTVRKRVKLSAVAICVIVTFCLGFSSTVSSRPFRIERIPDKGKGFGCGTCHINPRGGGARNSFGADYEKRAIKAGDTYTKDLGKADSDGDGFDNDREFGAGTHPGDPKSKP
jgi:hypothetical protein